MKLIFLGAPGSGKGTISNYLVNNYGYEHVSTGDLFRKTISQKGEFHNELKSIMMSGQLVDDELTNKIIKNEIIRLNSLNKNFILDGYPRNIVQAKFLDNLILIDKVINIEVDDNILMKRITGRLICPTCKSIYNKYYKKPNNLGICDLDNSLLIHRSDDEESIALKRLEVFKIQNEKLIEFYNNKKILYNINNDKFEKSIIKVKEICNIK